jgi:hypothetical protein
MQCRVPPGDTSQLTTGIGGFLSTPLRETSGTALTEPRAHSRIHCIARSVAKVANLKNQMAVSFR